MPEVATGTTINVPQLSEIFEDIKASQFLGDPVFTPAPNIIKAPVSADPWARGMSAVVLVKDRGIVRGTAWIDVSTGLAGFILGLETDRLDGGPKGRMLVSLIDSSQKVIAEINVGEIGIGGKTSGKARIDQYPGQANIPVDVASRVKSVSVSVQYTGQTNILSGILNGIIEAAKIAVTLLAS